VPVRSSTQSAVDSSDVRALRGVARRTRLFRFALVAAAVGLLALATTSARGNDLGRRDLLPGSTSVVVIDLSLSISGKDYRDIRRTVRRLMADGGRAGLVIFSDVAYELLPPGTPVSEFRPLLRLLLAGKKGVPVNPWTRGFSAGTQISSALQLAGSMLVRNHVRHGSILLVSDLISAPEDVPQLARTLEELRRESIPVRVVPLSPLNDGRTIFQGLLGKRAFIPPSELGTGQALRTGSPAQLPTGLIVLAGLLLAVLAANERFAGRLALPPWGRSGV
jgi:hypothetical protein